MTDGLAGISGRGQRVAFIARVLERQRAGQRAKPAVAVTGLTAAGGPGSAQVPAARPTPKPKPVPKGPGLAIACHEAAHAVVAVLFGGRVDRAELLPFAATDRKGRKFDGYCRYAPLDLATEQQQHFWAAAGPVAEAVFHHGPRPTGAQVDALLAKHVHDADELRQYALATGEPAEPAAVLPLVLRCWPAIACLAVDLDAGKAIAHSDVTAALGLSRDPGRHSFELANIRAGLRRVPDPRVA